MIIKVLFLNPFLDNLIVAIIIIPITAGLIPEKIGSIPGKLPYSTKAIAKNNVINIAGKIKEIPAKINPVFPPLT